MVNGKYILFLTILLLLVGCAVDDDIMSGENLKDADSDLAGQPVLFSAGNVRMTRADGIPYMAQNGRFVCTMYYLPNSEHKDTDLYDIRSQSESGSATTAWLKVVGNMGNAVYRLASFDETSMEEDPELHFDNHATMFYWQNRLPHAFLALADYNLLTDNDGSTTTQGKLKMYPHHDIDFKAPAAGTEDTIPLADNRYANSYDLTRGTRTSMTQQPDPILALTIQKPEGATREANRVSLYFKHQFSQIQVNIKGPDDQSADIEPEQVDSIELLGVAEEGYVVSRLNTNGTVGNVPFGSAAGTMNAASAKAVSLSGYSDQHIQTNKWGTAFKMFDMATGVMDENGNDKGYALGYLKSFNAIAFGTLWAIRVYWHEEEGTHIQHVATYEVPQTNKMASNSEEDGSEEKPTVYLRELQSGMRYVYDFELRRGTLAVIRTQILDWEQSTDHVHATNGTISKQ